MGKNLNFKRMKNALLSLFFGVFMSSVYAQTGWLQVNSFGTNPGNLLMYRYVPANIPANAPLVVVLHGCTQNATNYAGYSGWDTLANHHKFYVIHAEQQSLNNFNLCFNWFLPTDFHRGQGESGSVAQMVDYMKSQYSIDNTKVFVTGLSAGACLTTVMLGAYPDLFSAGAIMAGTPYKSATDATSAMNAMSGLISKTPAQWGDSVRSENPTFSGVYPKVAIFQGTSDLTVNQANATELVKQWTNVQNTDQVADSVNSSYNGNPSVIMKQYNNASGKTVVQTYLITNMQHGIAVDPGTCFQQGGTSGFNSYSFDEGFFSTFWAAEFFGIIQNPYPIAGLVTVNYGQTNLVYSVPAHAGSLYQWSFPVGVTIISGQGTNQITVNWGTISGLISVTETELGSCIVGPVDLYVTASNNTGIINRSAETSDITVFRNQTENSIHVLSTLNSYSVYIYDQTGNVVTTATTCSKNAIISLPENIKYGVYIVKVMAPNTVFTKKITLI
jgi:poly(hydroxyalkanoate) depolymerase family esterase